MSEKRTLSVGLIGCGTMGGSHATQLVTLPEVRLAVACDLDITRAEAVATQAATKGQTVRVTTDVATVLADPSIDGVIVATPNFTHKDLVLAALAAGRMSLREADGADPCRLRRDDRPRPRTRTQVDGWSGPSPDHRLCDRPPSRQ